MFAWLMNPWMLGLGGLAVLSPIVIHLLNKRRFKIVNWAAMDFLFEAEKKNRRRVQIENLLLLILRSHGGFVFFKYQSLCNQGCHLNIIFSMLLMMFPTLLRYS